ncbi:hypothetical protein AB4090_10920 [Acidithiobacillus sp. IBUN Pt1247-S3]|uniref:hypothetical protein n=1 Tax=Acidithiobacillus sp. IBUN Pt1247-S3 TaxID=3166642 RepID=UPI0034E4C708
MKIIYALIFLGAVALFALLFWADRPEIFAGSPQDGSAGWYRQHPQHLAAENLKCWKLLQQSSFADVERVMAQHPECHRAYEASISND